MSIASDPGSKAAIAPPSPSHTASTCGGAGSIVISTCAPRAHSATEPARPGARLHPSGQRRRIEVERGHVEPSLHEVTAHRTAHVPESDEPDPRDPGPLGGKRHHSATQVVFRWVYASSACSERSRPWPESFMPPNGVASDEASNVLIQTVPARRRRATR